MANACADAALSELRQSYINWFCPSVRRSLRQSVRNVLYIHIYIDRHIDSGGIQLRSFGQAKVGKTNNNQPAR